MSTETIDRAAVLARIEQERAWWSELLDEIGEERMELPGAAGDWTFKDVVAHLSAWRRRTIVVLEALRTGEEPPPNEWPSEFDTIEDEDEATEKINRWFYERDRVRSLDDILAEARGQYVAIRDIFAALPDEDLDDPARNPWESGKSLADSVMSGELFGHLHEEHEAAIRVWLDGLNRAG